MEVVAVSAIFVVRGRSPSVVALAFHFLALSLIYWDQGSQVAAAVQLTTGLTVCAIFGLTIRNAVIRERVRHGTTWERPPGAGQRPSPIPVRASMLAAATVLAWALGGSLSYPGAAPGTFPLDTLVYWVAALALLALTTSRDPVTNGVFLVLLLNAGQFFYLLLVQNVDAVQLGISAAVNLLLGMSIAFFSVRLWSLREGEALL